jgi:hypothetical protein
VFSPTHAARRCAARTLRAVIAVASFALSGCAPEVGSERWCAAMREKPAGDWSANEAVDFAQNCVLPDADDER